jgi:hypothetical protein
MSMAGFAYRLTWKDFPGRVPASADAGTAAFVSTHFRATAPWTYTGNTGSRVYTLTSVTCSVTLNRSSMWARPGASVRTAAMLAHEQGHFEISALLTRQVDQQLTALLDQTFSTQDDIEQAIRDARDAEFQLIADLQSSATGDGTYDVSTNHGLNTTQQGAWNRAFTACRTDPAGRLRASLLAQGITI